MLVQQMRHHCPLCSVWVAAGTIKAYMTKKHPDHADLMRRVLTACTAVKRISLRDAVVNSATFVRDEPVHQPGMLEYAPFSSSVYTCNA